MSKSQYRSFFLSTTDDGTASEALNRFIRSHTVVNVERVFVSVPVPGWAFCVVFELSPAASQSSNGSSHTPAASSKPRTDFRALLPADKQLVFDRMRDVRTELAEAEGKKRFHIMTDAQMFALLEHAVTTLDEFKRATKMSQERAQRYSEAFLLVLREQFVSTAGNELSEDQSGKPI